VARYLPKETRRYVERVEHFTAEFHGHPTSASFTDARQTTPTATGEEA
jgi:hypothetical protein